MPSAAENYVPFEKIAPGMQWALVELECPTMGHECPWTRTAHDNLGSVHPTVMMSGRPASNPS